MVSDQWPVVSKIKSGAPSGLAIEGGGKFNTLCPRCGVCYWASGLCWRMEMTTAISTERAVQRKRFHLHCACGATIIASKRTAACTACDRTIRFRGTWRVRQRLGALELRRILLLAGVVVGFLVFVQTFVAFGLVWAIFTAVVIMAVLIAAAVHPAFNGRKRLPVRASQMDCQSESPNERREEDNTTAITVAFVSVCGFLALILFAIMFIPVHVWQAVMNEVLGW